MTIEVGRLFARYGWAADEPEPGMWRTTFAAESDEEFDLYATVARDWLRLAITPLLPRPHAADRPDLYAALLAANALMTGARFALDDDGDIALHIDLPATGLTFAQFEAAVETLVQVVDSLPQFLSAAHTKKSTRFEEGRTHV